MRATELIPIVDHAIAQPATDLPELMFDIANEDGRAVVGWDELRTWLVMRLDISADDAEGMILVALGEGDIEARIGFENTWRVRAASSALRALFLRYALNRLDEALLHIGEGDTYEGGDRRLVLSMVPELAAFAEDRIPDPDPALYRRLLKRIADA